MSADNTSKWETTTVPNLLRYRPSEIYFARFKVAGKLYWKSLETTVFSVAKQRLPDIIRDHRSRLESKRAVINGKMTVEDATQAYLVKVDANASIKPRTKKYYHDMIDFIRRSWPKLFTMDVRKVSEGDCEDWRTRYQKQYAPIVVNNSISALRAIFDEAVKAGARFNNPAAELARLRVTGKRLELPTREQFLQFVETIRTAGARQSKDCASLVRFLAYSGVRIGEAKNVTWGDVNFTRRQLHVKGDSETGTKNGETRHIPLFPDLEQMLKGLRAERPNEGLHEPVMRVFECQNSMTNAAAKIGMRRITHHDLRHLFATMCIESGVDIPTVSRWLGHKDGGALCMKTYGHLREDHSLVQAQRVNFGAVVAA